MLKQTLVQMQPPGRDTIQQCRDQVCAVCPGTLWGQKSICRVHNKSIGQIEECPEWRAALERDSSHKTAVKHPRDGRNGDNEDDPMQPYLQKVDGEIRDFSWTLREVKRLEEHLEQAAGDIGWNGSPLVAKYGLEASLPGASGRKIGEMTLAEKQTERAIRRLTELKEKVSVLTAAAERIADEREKTILDCLMAGQRVNDISRHVGISRQRLNEIRHCIVRKLAYDIYREEIGSWAGLHI
jgi:hypothetical protein